MSVVTVDKTKEEWEFSDISVIFSTAENWEGTLVEVFP